MFSYPKKLRRKDIKNIEKYSCDEQIKDAYLKYLTNYSFSEFVEFCQDNDGTNMEDLLFKFVDLQLEKYEPNSIIWISNVMLNFMIYFDVNLGYGRCYDAYASALQYTVFAIAMTMVFDKVPFDEVPLPEFSKDCFQKLFSKCPDFRFNLSNDCNLAYNSFNNDFGFTSDEFYHKINSHFESEGY